jgi:hypothetical protein
LHLLTPNYGKKSFGRTAIGPSATALTNSHLLRPILTNSDHKPSGIRLALPRTLCSKKRGNPNQEKIFSAWVSGI